MLESRPGKLVEVKTKKVGIYIRDLEVKISND
jgi:hypothetical protein